MAGACAVAAPSPAATPISGAAPRRPLSLLVGCRRSGRRGGGGRASISCNANGAGAEPDSKGPVPQDDSSYLWTLGLGSVGGAAAVKYGSVLLPDITRPNIVQALLMVSLPMVAAVLILLKLSSTED
uniref:Uncharacterized protein n=1 Tax=Avena sativa TaxID=4498 RepID=A0ACD5Z9P7_AVESA